MTDPIADMLTRIRNAYAVKKNTVSIPASKLKVAVLDTLQKEGFVVSYQKDEAKPQANLVVTLKYENGQPALSSIRRISKPGRRIYSQTKAIKATLSGYGTTILSTSLGVMTDREAKIKKIGGEVICKVW